MLKNYLRVPLVINSFSKVPKNKAKDPWFGKFKCEKINNTNKLPLFTIGLIQTTNMMI